MKFQLVRWQSPSSILVVEMSCKPEVLAQQAPASASGDTDVYGRTICHVSFRRSQASYIEQSALLAEGDAHILLK